MPAGIGQSSTSAAPQSSSPPRSTTGIAYLPRPQTNLGSSCYFFSN
jgi:hypothetical protein